MNFDLDQDVIFAASDASTSEQLIASVIYHPRNPSTTTVEVGKIAVGEMKAIELCVERVLTKFPETKLIVLGT
jgi:hypothetical protein